MTLRYTTLLPMIAIPSHPLSMAIPEQHFWRDPELPFLETRAVNGGRACYDPHTHQSFSIGTVLNGQAQYLNRSRHASAETGSVVMINPGDVHACNPRDESTWSYRMLFIDSTWLGGVQREIGISLHQDLQMFSETLSHERELYLRLNVLLERLWQAAGRLEKETDVVDFLIHLHQRFDRVTLDIKSNQRLSQAAEYIAAHCVDDIALSDICDATQLSRSYLIRAFKRQYGMTPHAFLLNQRIHHAQSLLKQGLAIVDVAADCGFADQAHFQRVFKRHVAATPRQYVSA
jgi:AraC-like DNA-binding protein